MVELLAAPRYMSGEDTVDGGRGGAGMAGLVAHTQCIVLGHPGKRHALMAQQRLQYTPGDGQRKVSGRCAML